MDFALWKGNATTNAHQAETAARNAASHYARVHIELVELKKILDRIENKVPPESRDLMYHYKKAMQAYERAGKHANERLLEAREKLQKLESRLPKS